MSPKQIIIFVLAVIILGTAFLYYQGKLPIKKLSKTQKSESSRSCPALVSSNIDGIFKKIEGSSFYIQPKGQNEIKAINLTTKTTFFEMRFLGEQFSGQEAINKNDLKENDQISVIAACLKDKPDICDTVSIRRMIVR